MSKLKKVGFSLFIGLLSVLTALDVTHAQQAAETEIRSAESYSEAIQKTRHLIDSLMTDQKIPGVQLAVWHDGKMMISEGFGYADLEHKVAMWPYTKMRIGSVSKTLTSAAIGKLYQQGELDLGTPVQEYVPYFPSKKYEISTHEVAGHVAGIRHYREGEFLSNEYFATVREGIQIFADDTLLFEPGTDYSYSSYGWNLVSAVVEGASDQPFLSYMKSEVFEPIGMKNTVAEYMDSLIVHRTSYYVRSDDGKVLNAPQVDNSYKWAGGGFIGTAEDLIEFGKDIYWSDFLRSATVKMLTTSLELDSGEKTNYGIGWEIGKGVDGRQYYGHSGGSVGGSTEFVVFPEQRLILAVISNMSGVSYENTHLRIADFFMDAKPAN